MTFNRLRVPINRIKVVFIRYGVVLIEEL